MSLHYSKGYHAFKFSHGVYKFESLIYLDDCDNIEYWSIRRLSTIYSPEKYYVLDRKNFTQGYLNYFNEKFLERTHKIHCNQMNIYKAYISKIPRVRRFIEFLGINKLVLHLTFPDNITFKFIFREFIADLEVYHKIIQSGVKYHNI
jgi:hypothetical protein